MTKITLTSLSDMELAVALDTALAAMTGGHELDDASQALADAVLSEAVARTDRYARERWGYVMVNDEARIVFHSEEPEARLFFGSPLGSPDWGARQTVEIGRHRAGHIVTCSLMEWVAA